MPGPVPGGTALPEIDPVGSVGLVVPVGLPLYGPVEVEPGTPYGGVSVVRVPVGSLSRPIVPAPPRVAPSIVLEPLGDPVVVLRRDERPVVVPRVVCPVFDMVEPVVLEPEAVPEGLEPVAVPDMVEPVLLPVLVPAPPVVWASAGVAISAMAAIEV